MSLKVISPFFFTHGSCVNLPSNYSVLRESLSQIKRQTSDAKASLDLWKQAYLDVRRKIEQSGRDARWEFDRKKLFERSDYIGQICSDIHGIAQVCYSKSLRLKVTNHFLFIPRLLKSSTIYLVLS